jgi:Domain of unknown function (DUF4191)
MARNASPEPVADPAAQPEPPKGRMKQFLYAYQMTKKVDPKLGGAMLLWGGGAAVIAFLALFFAFGAGTLGLIIGIVFALVAGLLAAMATLSRRVQRNAYQQIDGQPGAAAAVLENDRRVQRSWTLTPMVQVNRQQDVVHRAIGRGGIVLLAEGDRGRVAQLVATERKAIARYLGPDVQVDELFVGKDEGAGQVPLNKLPATMAKRGIRGKQQLTPRQIGEYQKRLAAVSSGPLANIPKGPLPRGGRMPRGNFR